MRPPTAASEAAHAGMDRGRIGGDLTGGVARDWSKRLAMPVVDGRVKACSWRTRCASFAPMHSTSRCHSLWITIFLSSF